MGDQRIALIAACKSTSQFYFYAVRELKRTQREGKKDAFEDALQLAADARDQCEN